MSLKGGGEAGSADGSFSGFFHTLLVVAAAVGMWESRHMMFFSPDAPGAISKVCGKGGKTKHDRFSALSMNRHFHGPLPMLPARHADFLISSNMVHFACCMRRAASVSLMVAATRLSAARLSPGRRNCCGRSSESSFSSGVFHCL